MRVTQKGANMALNDTICRSLKPPKGKAEVLLADLGGLYLRVRVGARTISRTWQFRRQDGGRLAIVTIGVYPSVTLKEARVTAAALAAKRKTDVPTVSEAAAQWLSEVVEGSRKSHGATRWYLDRASRDIGDMRIDEVAPKHVADVVRGYRDTVSKRRASAGGRTAARLMLSALKGLGAYSVARGWVPTSPAAPISQAVIGAPRKARSRVLSDDEIRWVMSSDLPPAPVWRFLLATGLRVGEAYDGHREGQYWIVPASKSKNGYEHRVRLSPLALAQLEAAHPWTVPRWQTQTTLSLLRLGWSCHDLRSTVSTRLNEQGVAPHVVERLLNHRLKGVAAAYNHATYDDERREALEKWRAWLLALVDERPADVVPLRARA